MIPVVIVCVLAAVYLAGVALFRFFLFMPNTTLDGNDVSLKDPASVGAVLSSEKKSSWTDTVSGDGLSFEISAADIDLTYDGESAAREAMAEQNVWAWPLELASSRQLTLPDSTPYVSYDADKLSQIAAEAIDSATSSSSLSTEDGDIVYDETTQSYVVNSAKLAASIDTNALLTALGTDIRALSTSTTLGSEVLSTSNDVQTAADQANALLSSTVELTLAGTHVATVDASTIHNWITIGDDLSVTLSQDAISEWVSGDLSTMANSIGTARTFTRPDGVEESVPAGNGTYGWEINSDETAQDIYNNILSGSPTTLEMPCTSSAASYNPGGQDWPTRYIDVDISEQHAIFFDSDGSVIWEADVVTGLPNGERDTPQGVFYITSRRGATTLVGPDDEDGNPQWISYVDFWMGVVQNHVGFHNAPWRSAFGGEIYKTNGSHGCINLSYEDAEQLYNLVQVGDAVVIHP